MDVIFRELISPGTPLVSYAALGMLALAFYISMADYVQLMVALYRIQSLALFFIVAVISLSNGYLALLGFAILVPLLLAALVDVILARATVTGPALTPRDVPGALMNLRRLYRNSRNLVNRASFLWIKRGQHLAPQSVTIGINLIITAAAFAGVNLLFSVSEGADLPIDPISLAVSLALILIGLYTMINEHDMVAQVLGLLVMDHGMFLAAAKIIVTLNLSVVFVVALFFYTFITLSLLIFLLPALHGASGSTRLDAQQELGG